MDAGDSDSALLLECSGHHVPEEVRRAWVGGAAAGPCVGPCSQCPRRGSLHNGHQSRSLGSHPHPHKLEALASRSSRKAILLDCPACSQETVPWGRGHQGSADLQPLGATRLPFKT